MVSPIGRQKSVNSVYRSIYPAQYFYLRSWLSEQHQTRRYGGVILKDTREDVDAYVHGSFKHLSNFLIQTRLVLGSLPLTQTESVSALQAQLI